MTAPIRPPSPPRTIVFVKLDTFGDLVVFAPTLREIHHAWPNTLIAMVVRRAYADIGALLAPDVRWIPTDLQPFGQGPRRSRAEFDRVRGEIASLEPDILVTATSRRNWADIAFAATSSAKRRVALGPETEDEFFSTQMRLEFDTTGAAAFTQRIAIDPEEPDWRRNLRIAGLLLGRDPVYAGPALTMGAEGAKIVADFRRTHDLEEARYVVCAAAGFANVTLKTWPGDRFAAVLRHVQERHGWRIVLVGHENERPFLEKISSLVTRCVVWTGRNGGLTELAAITSAASLFIGNDTGAMHLAAALDIPVVAIFGGGTWPRFLPAGRRTISVVHPLPCFGCNWNCAFGDAPCIGAVTAEDVIAAVDSVMSLGTATYQEIHRVQHISEPTQAMMAKAAVEHGRLSRELSARQAKLEELTALDLEKDETINRQNREMVEKDRDLLTKEHEVFEKEASIDDKEREINDKERAINEKENEINEKEREINQKEREIRALKAACDEREKTIKRLVVDLQAMQTRAGVLEADKALVEKIVRELPPDQAQAAQALTDRAVHVRNLESLLLLKDEQLAELNRTTANYATGLHDLEQAKHYGRLLAEKEAVIRSLSDACAQREAVIKQLTAQATTATAKAHKVWQASRILLREKAWRPLDAFLFRVVVERHWMQIGTLRHYNPRPLRWDERIPGPSVADSGLPQLGIVTPSYGQDRFIERTMRSVLEQGYPKLRYVVQDGGSKDTSPAIVARYAGRLHHWESVADNGQADAISRGFKHIVDGLGPDDVMAWLNSDDLLGPGVMRFVAEYFVRHPHVDAIYGHRIIIDDDDREVGRWIMPRHKPATLEWIDYVPQETLFWRKRAWDLVGGIDPTFQFALDWDLLARFHQAGCRIVRAPYFFGAFRVHAEQKTSQAIHTTGADEMRRIRRRFHGERQDSADLIERHARDTRFWGAVTARLHEIGIRW